MGKFDAIYFGEDENNLGTGQFHPLQMSSIEHINWVTYGMGRMV